MTKKPDEMSYGKVSDDDYMRDRESMLQVVAEMSSEEKKAIVFYVDGKPYSLGVITIEVGAKTRLSRKLLIPVAEFIEKCKVYG